MYLNIKEIWIRLDKVYTKKIIGWIFNIGSGREQKRKMARELVIRDN